MTCTAMCNLTHASCLPHANTGAGGDSVRGAEPEGKASLCFKVNNPAVSLSYGAGRTEGEGWGLPKQGHLFS